MDWSTELKALRVVDGEVEADLAGPKADQTARFDYVYGADGPRSQVREAVGVAFEGYVHKRLWSIADAKIPDWPYPPDEAGAILHANGDMGFIIPIGPERYRTVSNTPETLGQIPGAGSATVLQAATFHLPVKQAVTYQAGPVYLGGDAAHVHSPLGARGMNLGIEDACAFARRFAAGELEGYTAERQPVGRRWIVLSERMLTAVQASDPLAGSHAQPGDPHPRGHAASAAAVDAAAGGLEGIAGFRPWPRAVRAWPRPSGRGSSAPPAASGARCGRSRCR